MAKKRKTRKINGLEVKDAKKSVLLVISPSDVRRGKKKAPTDCAAALACRRQLHASEARVHIARTYLRFNGHWERYHTSPALRAEIIAFDRGGKFEPGAYRLMKMQPSRKRDVGRPSSRTGRGKKRGKYHTLTNIRPMGLAA